MVTSVELEKRAKRHGIIFIVRCDLINWDLDPATRGWPATISSPSDTFFPGFLRLTPHSVGGRRLCANLNGGDFVRYRLGWNIYDARIAYKEEVSGQIWLHAFDVSNKLIQAARVYNDDGPVMYPEELKSKRLKPNNIEAPDLEKASAVEKVRSNE